MVEMCDSPVHQETRYDRQLRLWGEHGQAALEGARVLCIGVNATTCEVYIGLFCIYFMTPFLTPMIFSTVSFILKPRNVKCANIQFF